MVGFTGILAAAGGFAGVVTAINGSATDNEIGTNQPASAQLDVLNNATWSATPAGSSGTYCSPSSVVSSLEVRVTVQSGSNPTGSALNTWISCSTGGSWTISTPTNSGTTFTVLTVELRDAVSGVVRASGTVSLTATSEP